MTDLVDLNPIGVEALDELQSLIERSADYYEQVYGHPPGPAEATSVYSVLPDGVETYDTKILLAVIKESRMVGVIDAVRDWPSPGTWAVGLLLLEPGVRGRGLGTVVLERLEDRAAAEGAAQLRVGVQVANEGGLRFWQRNGFVPLDPEVAEAPQRLVKKLG